MRRAFWIAFLVLIVVIFINDIGRWVNAQSQLNQKTQLLADWTVTNLSGGTPTANEPIVIEEGASRGLKVNQYIQDDNTLRIWTSVGTPGTWVIGPYMALWNGTPIDQILSAPFVVRSFREARLL